MPQQTCITEPTSHQDMIQVVDLNCSERGEDLSNTFDSPCWPSGAGPSRIYTRAYSPPVAVEVGFKIVASTHGCNLSCSPLMPGQGTHFQM